MDRIVLHQFSVKYIFCLFPQHNVRSLLLHQGMSPCQILISRLKVSQMDQP